MCLYYLIKYAHTHTHTRVCVCVCVYKVVALINLQELICHKTRSTKQVIKMFVSLILPSVSIYTVPL